MKYNKNASFILLALTLILNYSCQTPKADTIQFTRNPASLDAITAQLEESNKIGFLYFTTATCGWCKVLQKEVFTDDAVRSLVDSNFIAYWINADSLQGRELSKHFKFAAAPTVMTIDANGDIIDKIIGYSPADEYLERLEPSVTGEGTFRSLKEQYEADTTNNEIALAYAVELFDQYDHETPVPIFENLIDNLDDPVSNGKVYYCLATCYTWSDKSKAVTLYEKGIEKDLFTDTRNEVLGTLGRMKYRAGQHEDVIKYVNMVDDDLSHMEKRDKRHVNRDRMFGAFSYSKLGQHAKAIEMLEELCQLAVADSNRMLLSEYGMMAIIYEAMAIEILPWTKMALELSPNPVPYMFDARGQLLAKFGRYAEAIPVYEGFLAANENSKESLPETYYKNEFMDGSTKLVAVIFAAGQQDKGQALLDELLANHPEEDVYSDLIAAVSRLTPQIPEALDWAIKSLDLEGWDNADLLRHYARLLFNLDRIQEAVATMETVYRLKELDYDLSTIAKYKRALEESS